MRHVIDYVLQVRADGLISITRSDGIELTPAPRERLGQALGPHWFSREDYEDVVRQLGETGRATKQIETFGGPMRQLS